VELFSDYLRARGDEVVLDDDEALEVDEEVALVEVEVVLEVDEEAALVEVELEIKHRSIYFVNYIS